MRGTIYFGEKPVELVANGATPVLYKRVFRRDFLNSANKADDMDIYVELAFIMAKQAEKPLSELINSLKYEDYLAWVEDFEAMDIISKVTDVFALYQGQAMQTSVSKKKSIRTDRPFNTALYLLRCIEVGINISDLDFFELGEIYDLLIEHSNDGESYDRIATQEDMDRF